MGADMLGYIEVSDQFFSHVQWHDVLRTPSAMIRSQVQPQAPESCDSRHPIELDGKSHPPNGTISLERHILEWSTEQDLLEADLNGLSVDLNDAYSRL